MRNKILFISILSLFAVFSVAHADYEYSTEDPMYLAPAGNFVSSTSGTLGDSIFLLTQKFSYGINGILSVGANIKYQQDFNGTQDDFSNIGLDGVYRLSRDTDVISDVLFGLNFEKNSKVYEFSNTTYMAGLRMGRRWNWVTVAGTVKTSWVFDELDGVAFIDLIPETYFRINDFFGAGLGIDYRKATNPDLDRKWINAKVVQTYGRTQYVETVSYELDTSEFLFGGRINIVF